MHSMKKKTLSQIIAERPEISKLIMEKYPVSKDEKAGCVTEKAFRDKMRWEFAKKLYYGEEKEKKEYGKADK
jgi:hypothetical protein